MELFRVMCRAELEDLREHGHFRQGPNAASVKWFAERLEDAVKWGRQFESWDGVEHAHYVKIVIADELAARFEVQGRRDGIGPARCASLAQLSDVQWFEVTP